MMFTIGNTGGDDFASISHGLVRDKNFTSPVHETALDSIMISAPNHPGSSGSCILDIYGKYIGMISWGHTNTFSGGPKGDTAEAVMRILVNKMEAGSGADYVEKRFLGLEWLLMIPEILLMMPFPEYSSDGCVIISEPSEDSPFYNKFDFATIILSFIIDGTEYKFGFQSDKVSPDTVTHLINTTKEITVTYKSFFDPTSEIKTTTVTLDKDYTDKVDYDIFDGFGFNTANHDKVKMERDSKIKEYTTKIKELMDKKNNE